MPCNLKKCQTKQSESMETEPKGEETCAQTENVVSIETTETQTDFYQILGVDEDASYQEIKKKWLKLSLIYHPDKCDGNDEMFRKINLAYKVLSNPENRQKYNDSLAKTYDQLKDENRDTDYHVNEDFLKTVVEEDGDVAAEFDREKFMAAFESKRHQFKELNEVEVINEQDASEMPKTTVNDAYKLMADRDRELEQFRQEQQTDLRNFDPRHHKEQFNYVFNQFRQMTRTDLEESDMSDSIFAEKVNPNSNLEFAPVNFDYMSGQQTNSMLRDLTSSFSEQFGDGFNQQPVPVVTSQPKIAQSRLEELMAQRKLETEQIREEFDEKAKVLDDSDKLVMQTELLTPGDVNQVEAEIIDEVLQEVEAEEQQGISGEVEELPEEV